MIRHCVLMRYRADSTAEQHRAVLDGLHTLPGEIDVIERFDFGPDAVGAEGNWDLAVTADFADESRYLEYAAHPAHVRLITEHIRPILADRAAVQFEITD